MVVFMFQVLFHYAKNPNTLFVVAETTFLDLRNKTEDKLKTMPEYLQKLFIVEFPDGKGISCFYSGLEVVPFTNAGFSILFFNQAKEIQPCNRMTQDRPGYSLRGE
jgi:hypothetical protein